jgi:hypothetical protein
MEKEKEKKRWPREYYATRYECTQMSLRRSSPARARRAGVFGWRSWDSKNTQSAQVNK